MAGNAPAAVEYDEAWMRRTGRVREPGDAAWRYRTAAALAVAAAASARTLDTGRLAGALATACFAAFSLNFAAFARLGS